MTHPVFQGAKLAMCSIAVMLLTSVIAACGDENDLYAFARTPQTVGGDPAHGQELLQVYGCVSCHKIPGVQGATGVAGPPLYFFARRTYIAGMLPNNPDNLMRWIQDPQSVVPGNVMPNMGVSQSDAQDIAAYLYTIR